MAEITFLAPGSCQLEVTAQGTTGTDTGVDLASVSWTIEQALIAGCRFSPSAGDVHIDRNGVLTIGRSLFDRINQASDDDAIPGQCTLIIRADSTITRTVLDRFKVLVGYPGEGGGGGGGEAQTSDVYLWNMNGNVVPSKVEYVSGYSAGNPTYTQLEIEPTTTEFNSNTVYGIKIKDCPAGGILNCTLPDGYQFGSEGRPSIGYSDVLFPVTPGTSLGALIPIDGMYQAGPFVVVAVD